MLDECSRVLRAYLGDRRPDRLHKRFAHPRTGLPEEVLDLGGRLLNLPITMHR